MPGWVFTVESSATKHLLRQFKIAIKEALASSTETRALMRARSSLQRFPVAQWREDLEKLQSGSIKMHQKVCGKRSTASSRRSSLQSVLLAGVQVVWEAGASVERTVLPDRVNPIFLVN